MNLTQNQLDSLSRVLSSDGSGFADLVRVAGLDPAHDFRGADLQGVDFGTDDISGFDFSNADLRGADLSHARGVDKTILVGALTDDATHWPEGSVPKLVALGNAPRSEDTRPRPDRAPIAGASHHTADALLGTGVRAGRCVHWNLTAPALVTEALRRVEGRLSTDGALMVQTGVHTGRSAQDKFVVDEPSVTNDIWWGRVNNRLSLNKFEMLRARVAAYLQGQELFTQDVYVGAHPDHRVRVRIVTTYAWAALFSYNIFIRPDHSQPKHFEPDYVILHAPLFQTDPAIDGTRSGTVIALSFEQRIIVIAGTEYGGEIQKAAFTMMNWLMPAQGILPMNCAANVGARGDVAIFFGLSGTGKTTLSVDSHRRVLGDAHHGWGKDGVFSFDGGSYAKVINLSHDVAPEIWAASHRFGTILENVIADENGAPDFHDDRLSENSRAGFPTEFIPEIERSRWSNQPSHVVMLTCDAFGVLPPISRLTPAQAMYHYLSGYTALVAGTEKELGAEPVATFSTCFAAPFLARRPEVYGRMLAELIASTDTQCWLVNTGWTGGRYGVGTRMSVHQSRMLLRGAFEGDLQHSPFRRDPFFGLSFPEHYPKLNDVILDPRRAWTDKAAYDVTASELAKRFEKNFAGFEAGVGEEVRAAAIRYAA